jgi:tetratricopeptide (TPR) repeat protein
LATAYSHIGEHEKAHELFKKTLFDQQAAYPPDGQHLDVATTLHHMGNNLIKMNRRDDALKCYRQCLNMEVKFLSETSVDVLNMITKIKELENNE